MDKQEELRGLLKEVMGEEIKKAIEESEKRNEERIKALEALTAEQRAKIEALEKMPAQPGRIAVPGKPGQATEVLYRGRDLGAQGWGINRSVKEKIAQLKMEGLDVELTDLYGRPITLQIASEEKRERYAKWMIDFIQAKVFDDAAAKAALQEGTDSEGGYIVPDEFTDEILAFARLQSFALRDCRIWPMKSDTRKVPAEDGAVSVSWTDEESAITESEPTLAEVTLTAKRLDAYSKASNEFLEDASTDVVSWLTELFAEAIGQELDNQVLNGTGSPCSGVLTAAAGNSVVLGSGEVSFSSIDADDLSNAIAQLPVNRLAGARWYFHRTVLHHIRILKDDNNNYIFAKPGNGVPGTIWEYPYTLSEKAPAATAASQASKGFIVFGNMRYFALGRRKQNMTLDVDPYGLFTTYQTRFRIVNRWGMSVGLAGGFCRIVTAAS
ncbi:MAG: phage major capsid protein [Deltaproteobacteria bacterium]|nr:phage major capsid protein [Deltaproteobacteria bacterium]MBW2081682.1 phage major capsid protein [Deltaproteobacteria bacterium]MBW2298877.1 phage major capsid protein [Deltaproteobacteria bacterium]